MRFRKPRLRTVLLAANLLLLVLPLGGLWLLRLYESALVRQTETELVAQAAVIGAAYEAAWHGGAPPASQPGWAPRWAVLDLARDPVLPPAPDALAPERPADPRALAAGATLMPVLAAAQRVTLAGMRVTDAAGIVVASSGGEMGLSLHHRQEVAAALAGRSSSVLRDRPAQPGVGSASISRAAPFRVFLAHPVTEGAEVIGVVVLSRTPASIDQALHGKRWEMAGLAAALLLAAGGLALVIAYTVSRPIEAVAAQARAVAAGARATALPRTRRAAVREADEMWAAIQSMAATLEYRADYIGAFAAEMSHEFKTPLAAIRGALELLADHAATMTEAERATFLGQAASDVARLDRLVRRLLELARAEAPVPRGEESCDVAAVIHALPMPVPVALEGGALRAAIGAERLSTVIRNMTENIALHAGPGATGRIAWRAEGRRVVIEVSDDGRGVSPGNAGRIFGRFFTTAREAGGTGLGLAIARSHLAAAGGSIELVPSPRGACFRLSMPAA
ncbi:sensor histidine kinase [Falsiroseomonas algicola]|uniref:sensor histidine kinase n=1 Tax=Falsiroseomonas algicola TaxID=2716930 RepID=UPI0013DF824D|nr:HAMP domain-containing sensor histidine kinase [Falsiroseomonas algicola]